MSSAHGFKIVVAMLAGLASSAAWAQIDAAEVKTGEAQTIETNPTALAAGAGSVQLTITNPDGVKEAEAEQYGKRVRITEDPQKGIKIERTTNKGGTDVTEKFEAKNVKELEKKSPEGFKLYQQYLGNQGEARGTVILGGTITSAPGLEVPVPVPAGGVIAQGGNLVLPQAALTLEGPPGQISAGPATVEVQGLLAAAPIEQLGERQ